jgi:hypothetical protein
MMEQDERRIAIRNHDEVRKNKSRKMKDERRRYNRGQKNGKEMINRLSDFPI